MSHRIPWSFLFVCIYFIFYFKYFPLRLRFIQLTNNCIQQCIVSKCISLKRFWMQLQKNYIIIIIKFLYAWQTLKKTICKFQHIVLNRNLKRTFSSFSPRQFLQYVRVHVRVCACTHVCLCVCVCVCWFPLPELVRGVYPCLSAYHQFHTYCKSTPSIHSGAIFTR